jgi:hypothetical protein
MLMEAPSIWVSTVAPIAARPRILNIKQRNRILYQQPVIHHLASDESIVAILTSMALHLWPENENQKED